MNLSAVILAKNNESKIEKVISNLSFCDEVILIDDLSDDKTVDLARKMGAKTFVNELNYDFAEQRNFGLSRSSGKWTLFIDSDELISPKLKDEIIKAVGKENGPSGYLIKRSDMFLGKRMKYGEAGNKRLLRLGLTKAGKWKRKIHETWKINGSVGTLDGELIHSSHESLDDFIEKINLYSSIHAQENFREGKTPSLLKIVLFPLGKFLYNYFFKFGFLDGGRGFVFALMMSLHSFLAWSKLWILTTKTK